MAAVSGGDEGLVVVLGARGRTGLECVKYCVETKRPVRACVRSGTFDAAALLPFLDNGGARLVEPVVADVTKPATLGPAVRGASLVIFAATASASGDPGAVDHLGLASCARACLGARVPRLVVVSGAGVTQRASPAFKLLNLFGRRMDAKVRGEEAVRSMYFEYAVSSQASQASEGSRSGASSSSSSLPAYTIVRASGLGDGPRKGAAALEVNQGDGKAGAMGRADVAALCVECAASKAAAFATFECYDAGTALATETLSVSGILSDPKSAEFVRRLTNEKREPAAESGRECRGESYALLFAHLERDGAPQMGS